MKQVQPCSVCIAAHNERATLPKLLSSLAQHPPELVDEILICLNGCTDDTPEIVAAHAERDPRIRSVESLKGKPRAWNQLVAYARNETLLFLDADVEIEAGALERLLRRFQPGVVIVAGLDRPRTRRFDPRSWLLAYLLRPRLDRYLNGRLYAVRRGALLDRMERQTGTRLMAENLLHEDFWLQTLLSPDELVVAHDARVFYDPGSLADYPRIKARLRLGHHQIAEEYAETFQRWRRTRQSPNRTAAQKLRAAWREGGLSLTLTRALDLVVGRLSARIWGGEIDRLYAEMRSHLEAVGGQHVLAGPGRIRSSKGEADPRNERRRCVDLERSRDSLGFDERGRTRDDCGPIGAAQARR